jgi:hypothetical protein
MYTQVYCRRANRQASAMAPRRAAKANVEVAAQGPDNVSDTSPRTSGSVSTWSSISNILQSGLINCSDSDDDNLDIVKDDMNTKYKAIVQSGMHLVATRPRLLPYYDMIRWALDHVDLSSRTILSDRQAMVGTFRPEHIQSMYKLPATSEYTYGKEFLAEFKKKECEEFDRTLPGLIKDWVSRSATFRVNNEGVYSISSLEPNFMYVAMMACRLFGWEDTAHFYIQWVPLIYRVAEGSSFNWAKMLSDSLFNRITEYREKKAAGKPAGFYMSAYIMDAICSLTPFPLMKWAWSPTHEKTVHEYHDKLWENNANKFIYEIFNWVMVPLHVTIFGLLPPRISDSIAENLSHIADWYVEEEFSYLRVFGAAVPPSALPLFIPDKLACREIARQTVIGGVSKELKASAKKVWPSFPIRLNSYSLLDFGHAKAEAAALEDLSLAYIEYKKHDPQRIVSTHLGNCGLKRFEHEYSPSDDVFRGARSYSEVQFRIGSLAPEDRASVLKFQGHRKRCLPVVLGGLGLPKDKEKEAESSEGKTSNPEKRQEGEQEKKPEKEKSPEQEKNPDKEKSPEQEKNPETEKENTDPPKEHSPEVEIKDTDPPETQNPETGTKTSDPPKEQDPLSTPGKGAKQIGQPIASVTPLQSAQGGVSEGWIFGEELRPIRAEELPPNEFFFDKKRKAVVKREFYQEGESTVKKFKVMTDGRNKKKDEFATEIAGTLGAYATANQYSVEMLKRQLKAKNRLIKTLEARVASAAESARSQVSGEIELAQLANKKEIEVLKTKLEQANSTIRDGRVQSGQQRDMITQLQAQLEVTKSKTVDIETIKSRATDIRSRISSAKKSLLNKVGEIREDCLLIQQISENLTNKERNAEAARVAFQEAVIATNNRFSGPPGLTIAEQTRGNILLKNWEQDITLSKEQAQKVTNLLEEAINNINGEQIGIEIGGDTEALRQINIDQISLDIKEENERNSAEISKMDRVDPAQIDKHLIQPSAQLGALELVDIQVDDKLPQLARECYLAEARCQAEPSQLVTQFVDKCMRYTESMRGQAPSTS